MNQVAFLFHLFYWEDNREKIKLSDGVTLCKSEGSNVYKCYENLCANSNIHDGEPLGFEAFLLIDIKKDDAPYFYSSVKLPDVSIARFCTLFSILSQGPPVLIYSIFSVNKFKDTWGFKTYFDDMGMFDHFESDIKKINFGKLKLLWSEIEKIYLDNKNNSRLKQALNFFFYSWNNYSLEQMCLNLSIVLEILFSPDSYSELSHRMAYNFCHFIGRNKDEREYYYNFFKKFYTLRSKIVHGSSVKHDDLFDVVPKMFVYVCEILEEILRDDNLQKIFTDDNVRNRTLNDWLFA